jgi:uncharacterized protein YjlB
MTIASNPTAPIIHKFADDGSIPHNAALPLVLYRGGIDLADLRDPEELIEKSFAQTGWDGPWRNGNYRDAHCHSRVHKALGIARGRATVHFGSMGGCNIAINTGDVVILPIGSGDRGSKAEHDRALAAIANVPPPPTDPAFAPSGPLMKRWRA